MTYVKYKTKDYAEGQFLVGFTSGDLSFQLKAGQGARFPSLSVGEKFIGTCEKRSGSTVTSKERVLVTARSTDTFTITRSYGGDTALDFDANDYFCLHVNSDVIVDIQDEVSRLETDKADDNSVVHDTGDETIAGIKTFSSFPISPSAAPTTDYQVANKKYVDDEILSATPFASDAQANAGLSTTTVITPAQLANYRGRTYAGITYTAGSHAGAGFTNTTYQKKYQGTVAIPGVYTVAFKLRTDSASFAVTGRIYKNGVAYGTERSTTSTGDVTYTEDLFFAEGDVIEFWGKVAGATTYYLTGMSVKYDVVPNLTSAAAITIT